MMTMYAVVYGPEWEDVYYYTSLDKAKSELLKKSWNIKRNTFYPLIQVFTEYDGVLEQHDKIYEVNEEDMQDVMATHTYEDFCENILQFRHLVKSRAW